MRAALVRLLGTVLDLAAWPWLLAGGLVLRCARPAGWPAVGLAAPPGLPAVGGCEHQTLGLARWLAAHGVPTTVFLVGLPRNIAWVEEGGAGDLQVHLFGRGRLSLVSFGLQALGLLSAVRQHRVGTLLCPSVQRENLAALAVARVAGVRLLLRHDTVGRLTDLGRGDWVDRLAFRWSLRADIHISLSGDIDDELTAHNMPAGRIQRLPNGRDTRHFAPPDEASRQAARQALGLDSHTPMLLYAGRFEARKRLDVLLSAMAQLAATEPGARLFLVGDGADGEALQALAGGLGIVGRVRFVGLQADVRPYLHAADLFIMPSEREGMPNAVIEAMACGLPVVAADVGGTHELLAGGVGRLVPSGDAKALAEAIGLLLANEPERRRLGSAARARAVTEYDSELNYGRYARLLTGR